MTQNFTAQDHNAAAEHGWQLVPVWDTRGYPTWMVMPLGRVETPSQAQASVIAQAKRGVMVARKALALIAHDEIAGKSKTPPRRKK